MTGHAGDPAGAPRPPLSPHHPPHSPLPPLQREQDPAGPMPEPDDVVTEAITVPTVRPPAEARPAAAEPAEEPAEAAPDPGPDPSGGELVPVGTGVGGPSPAHRHPDETSRRQWWMKAVAVALCGLLGLSLAAQLNRNERDGALAGARQEDLVRILDELDSREQRLQAEINQLQERRRTLSSDAEGSQTVQAELERRAEELGILAGTVAAQGTGLRLVFEPGSGPLTAEVILDAVEELRGAGAEAMQITGRGGSPVRIVAATAFLDTGDGHLLVGGREQTGPYTLLAIGDPETMRAALAIPGGVEDAVRDAGGTVHIDAPDRVDVDATLSPATPEYAEPVD